MANSMPPNELRRCSSKTSVEWAAHRAGPAGALACSADSAVTIHPHRTGFPQDARCRRRSSPNGRKMSAMDTEHESAGAANHVFLRGRLAADPVFRDLPSGDVLAVFRVTVPRPAGDRVRVDSIECATMKPKVHKSLARAVAGDDVEVVGSLHRRFWRTATGPASRYAVDADSLRVKKAGRRGGASRDRTPASA